MSDDIAWGDCTCSAPGCMAVAECALDGTPYCIDCADYAIDRLQAVTLYPEMRELLPDFADR